MTNGTWPRVLGQCLDSSHCGEAGADSPCASVPPAIEPAMTFEGSQFDELLKKLSAEHSREVEALRREVSQLSNSSEPHGQVTLPKGPGLEQNCVFPEPL